MHMNLISQLITAAAEQTMTVPKGGKEQPSAFDKLMREQSRGTAPEQSTAPAEKTPAAVKDAQAKDGEDAPAADTQYALAAAFLMPQIIVPAEAEAEQTNVLSVPVGQMEKAAAEVQGELPQTAAPAAQADLPQSETAFAQAAPAQQAQVTADAPQTEQPALRPEVQDKAAAPLRDAEVTTDADQTERPDEALAETVHRPVFDDVYSVPVKVGETEAAVDTEAPDLDAQLAKQVTAALDSGDSQVSVRLNPENLGTMQVQLTRSSDGSLHVLLNVTSDKALGLLERHSTGLQNLLMAHIDAPVKIEVQHSGESQQAMHQQLDQDGKNQQGNHGRQRQPSREETNPEDFLQQLRLGLVEFEH